MGFGRKALFFGSALALGVAMSAAEQAEADRRRKARQLSGEQITSLLVLGVVAVLAAGGLAHIGSGPLALTPLFAWGYTLRSLRRSNEQRARQPKADQRQVPEGSKPRPPIPPRPLADDPLNPTRQARNRQRPNQSMQESADQIERVENLGAEGAMLYGRAESTIHRIMMTEAARSGWLGDLQKADFGADLEAIAANSRSAKELSQLIKELSAIAHPNADDRALLDQARIKITELDRSSRERVELLDKCWAKAKLIDVSIREEREQAAIAEMRDDVHGRMAAVLYDADARSDRPSSAAERVLAFEAAYREVKGMDEQDALSDDQQAPSESPDPAARKRNPFRWFQNSKRKQQNNKS